MALQGNVALSSQNPFPDVERHYNAYKCTFDLQSASTNKSDLVKARLLGHMLLEFDEPSARDILSNEINSCSDNSKLKELADLYINHFIRLCKFYASASIPSTDDTSYS